MQMRKYIVLSGERIFDMAETLPEAREMARMVQSGEYSDALGGDRPEAHKIEIWYSEKLAWAV